MICDHKECNKKRSPGYKFCTKHKKLYENSMCPKTNRPGFSITAFRDIATLRVSCKNRNDYADYDYIDVIKTDKNVLNFIMGFHREFVNADFGHKYKKLHRSKKTRKICYDANNARNRDLYGHAKVRHELYLCSQMGGDESEDIRLPVFEDYEDYLIKLLDEGY